MKGQTPKSDVPPNIAPKIVTPETYLQICDSSATLIGQLVIVTLFGAILGGIPVSGPYPFIFPELQVNSGKKMKCLEQKVLTKFFRF